MNKKDIQIAIPAIIPNYKYNIKSRNTVNFWDSKRQLLDLQIIWDSLSIIGNPNSKLFWGSTTISDEMFVNFAASVMDSVLELSANKFECVKINNGYFGISYSTIFLIIIIFF